MDVRRIVSVSAVAMVPQDEMMYAIKKRNGFLVSFELAKITTVLKRICANYCLTVSLEPIIQEVKRNLFEGIATLDVETIIVQAAAAFIERDPGYAKLAAGMLLQRVSRDVIGKKVADVDALHNSYREAFVYNIEKSVRLGLLDKRMLDFDLQVLAASLVIERDKLLGFTGVFTLNERYFLKHEGTRLELPQSFWMRIAMGLSLLEEHKTERALEFYEILSTLRYTPSTPTLFHSGYPVAQLSSCYLSTINDDLAHIFKCFGDNAQLSKWAGGIGTDFTNLRANGSYIKGIKAYSNGVVPYLKIANDTVVCIALSGIRRGGMCAYLEIWHLDFEDFLDLRRNTGDERRRTHDLNTAAWIPDLFMKRIEEDGAWTFFSPDEAPDLHDSYGASFEQRYTQYEQRARDGALKNWRQLPARQLWRKMLTRLFETGHPWITFKDPCNIRSPQDHVGVIHSSNLCTEITLATSADETAVCNLGSINFAEHIQDAQVDYELLEKTITTAVRMLDNVIDINFYPTKEAAASNKRHRPVGLGQMGFQDALFKLDIPFSDERALVCADELSEKFSYYAIKASCQLAKEKGAYSTCKGSKWDRGIFPFDTVDLLEKERGRPVLSSRKKRLDWDVLKKQVMQYGMRNSNVMAIAPTATISTIVGCFPSIEPIYKNIYVKSNVTGEFTIVNEYLINDLKSRGLWSQSMLDVIKYCDGDVSQVPFIPDDIKEKYKTAFELDPVWLIKIAAERGKWLDQSQSYNTFIKGATGAILNDVYKAAWDYGLKTTYYCRTLGASQIEKSTLDAKAFGFTQLREYKAVDVNACSIENQGCESCQ